MKNLMNKIRKANKGFTLVELIIVIAVIAVLSAVVAPQYIKYVERSRQGVDASVLQEVKHIVEIEAGTTETLVASEVIITVAADKTGSIEGTNSFAGPSAAAEGANAAVTATAAYTNIENTVGNLTFKSANAVGEYTLKISATGEVTWDGSTTNPVSASAADIAALEKGTKVVGG